MREKIAMVFTAIVVSFVCYNAYLRIDSFYQKHIQRSEPKSKTDAASREEIQRSPSPSPIVNSAKNCAPGHSGITWSIELPGDEKCAEKPQPKTDSHLPVKQTKSVPLNNSDILISNETYNRQEFEKLSFDDQASLLLNESLKHLTILRSSDISLARSCNEAIDRVNSEKQSGRSTGRWLVLGFVGAYNHC